MTDDTNTGETVSGETAASVEQSANPETGNPEAGNGVILEDIPAAPRFPRDDKEARRRAFETGQYPYPDKIKRNDYEKQKAQLQVELLKVQDWVRATGQKIVLLFEGRDAAGKGGAIKRFMEHLNPRGAKVVALEKPSDRDRTLWFFQRYIEHLPQAAKSFCLTGPGTTVPGLSGS